MKTITTGKICSAAALIIIIVGAVVISTVESMRLGKPVILDNGNTN